MKSASVKTAFLFPGQGSQYVGMGKALAEAHPIARKTFKTANKVTGRDIREICYDGPVEQLKQTENTQVAILTVSVAAWRVLNQAGLSPAIVAGHSLGEYAALVASNVLSFEDALRVVQQRATFMAEAAMGQAGGMMAVLGLDEQQVSVVCDRVARFGFVQIANINSSSQIVISGESSALPYAMEFALEAGARRCIPLRVSGAFHSKLMTPAASRLFSVLDRIRFSEPEIPIIANITGDYVPNAAHFTPFLTQQVTDPVQWNSTVERMWDADIRYFVEVGPGNVLSGLVKRAHRDARVFTVGGPEEVKVCLEDLDAA